jgi:hypothetical protein
MTISGVLVQYFSANGKSINEYLQPASAVIVPDEEELLLKPGSAFIIKSITPMANHITEVRMTEIPCPEAEVGTVGTTLSVAGESSNPAPTTSGGTSHAGSDLDRTVAAGTSVDTPPTDTQNVGYLTVEGEFQEMVYHLASNRNLPAAGSTLSATANGNSSSNHNTTGVSAIVATEEVTSGDLNSNGNSNGHNSHYSPGLKVAVTTEPAATALITAATGPDQLRGGMGGTIQRNSSSQQQSVYLGFGQEEDTEETGV